MENRQRTLTIDELTELTGFDRRTIAYYVQEGLLPKVGRRGRLTRYPRFIADRLLFIKRLREAEEAGDRSSPLTLAEIRAVFDRTAPELIAEIAAGETPVDAIEEHPDAQFDDFHGLIPPEVAAPVRRFFSGPPDEMASGRHRMEMMLEETAETDLFVPGRRRDTMAVEETLVQHCREAPDPSERSLSKLGRFEKSMAPTSAPGPPPEPEEEIDELLNRVSRLAVGAPQERAGIEHWTQVAITPGFKIAGLDLGERGDRLLEKLAMLLRRRIGRRD